MHERAGSCCRQTDRDVKGGVHEDVEDRPNGKIGPECEPVGPLFLSSLTIFQFDPEQRSFCSSSKTVDHPKVLNHQEYSSRMNLGDNNMKYSPMKMSPNTNLGPAVLNYRSNRVISSVTSVGAYRLLATRTLNIVRTLGGDINLQNIL